MVAEPVLNETWAPATAFPARSVTIPLTVMLGGGVSCKVTGIVESELIAWVKTIFWKVELGGLTEIEALGVENIGRMASPSEFVNPLDSVAPEAPVPLTMKFKLPKVV